MNIDPAQEPLTAIDLRVALQTAWPSIEPEMVTFVSGTTIKSTVWQFTIEITLTTNPIVFGEKAGAARMSFQWRPPGMKVVTIKTGTATEIAVVSAFIRYCKMYLNGIAAAIERAGEQPPPTPEADIFR